MKVLVVNAGSSSLKYQLIDMSNEKVIAKGLLERIGQSMSTVNFKYQEIEKTYEKKLVDHTAAFKVVLDSLVGKNAPLNSMSEIDGVGHRVVHSGEKFLTSVKLDKNSIKDIESISDLAPLHNPANLAGIKACLEIMPTTPSVAVFDTTFHSSMPSYAYMYAIPYELYEKYAIRKYGFHGTSHKYVSEEVQRLLNKSESKIVVCHLGNGASVSAVCNGKCIDTSMGLTPLEGLVMGTRSGDIDPSVVEYIMLKTGKSVSEVSSILNKKSGVLGLSGVSSDFRDIHQATKQGNARAELAINKFCYSITKYIGAYAAAMGGLDAIAFTAGIGENSHIVRSTICGNLKFLGVEIDIDKNQSANSRQNADISTNSAITKVFVIPTNEELVIARDTVKFGFVK